MMVLFIMMEKKERIGFFFWDWGLLVGIVGERKDRELSLSFRYVVWFKGRCLVGY